MMLMFLSSNYKYMILLEQKTPQALLRNSRKRRWWCLI